MKKEDRNLFDHLDLASDIDLHERNVTDKNYKNGI